MCYSKSAMIQMKASIDKGIVGVVNAFNKAGFATSYSCSGHGNQGYISFKRAMSINKSKEISDILLKYGIKRFKLLDLNKSHEILVRPNQGVIRYVLFLLPGARVTNYYARNPQRRDSKIIFAFKRKCACKNDLKNKRLKFI